MSRFSARRPPDEGAPVPSERVEYDRTDAYRIMRAKLTRDGFAHGQIDSFNDFVLVKIPQCLSEHAPVVVTHDATNTEHIVEILNVRFDRPSVREANGEHRYVTPHECHLRRISYQFNMLVSARYTIRRRNDGHVMHTVIFRDKLFDRIPCMKMSDFCTSQVAPETMMEDEAECGGYFISTGAEKVVVGQEGPRTNYPFITEANDGSLKCECRSFNEKKFRSTSTLYTTLHPTHKTSHLGERRISVPRVSVHIPFVNDALPLPVTFKLLGVPDIEGMRDHICADSDPDWFRERVLDVLLADVDAVVMTHEYAVTRLAHDRGPTQTYSSRPSARRAATEQAAKRRKRFATETDYERCCKQVAGLLSTEFLPHQGYTPECTRAKAVWFGTHIVRKLLRVYYGLQEKDSRDHYMHRRVSMVSSLMTLLFRKHWTMWRRRLASQIRRELDGGAQFVNVKDLLRANIGNHLSTALSTGNFSMQRGANNMDGVGQVLSRTEPHSAVSHVNRTSNPMNKDGRAIQPRLQHPSCLGIIDAWETPEGQSCGLMRNKAPMAGIRVGYPTDVLTTMVMSTGMVDAGGAVTPVAKLCGVCPVFVSGTLIGSTQTPDELMRLLRARRSTQDLPFDVSIFRTAGGNCTTANGEIHLNGDGGSYWWPLIRVDRMHRLRAILDHISNDDEIWSALTSEGVIEVINKDEEATSVRVALYHRQLFDSAPGTYTHVVIHPSQICSVFTARGPLLEFNQAPRVTYQAAMGKQAIGRPMTNRKYRADTAAHELWYYQRPLVTTFMDDTLSPDGVSSVQNPTVAILCAGGYNIEDSVIFNRASIDRGLFRSSVVRTFRDVVRTTDNEEEVLGLADEACKAKLHADYSKINPRTGTVDPGTWVDQHDVTISKHVKISRKYRVEDEGTGETREVEEIKQRDRSTSHRSREQVVVDDVIMSRTLEGEQTVRLKTRAMRVPEVGDKFACMPAGHDVLTLQDGWIDISRVREHHHVACLDPDTLQLRYDAPTDVHRYDKAPRLIHLRGHTVSQQVTPEHRLPLWNGKSVEMLCATSAIAERGRFEMVVAAVNGMPPASETAAWAFVDTRTKRRRTACAQTLADFARVSTMQGEILRDIEQHCHSEADPLGGNARFWTAVRERMDSNKQALDALIQRYPHQGPGASLRELFASHGIDEEHGLSQYLYLMGMVSAHFVLDQSGQYCAAFTCPMLRQMCAKCVEALPWIRTWTVTVGEQDLLCLDDPALDLWVSQDAIINDVPALGRTLTRAFLYGVLGCSYGLTTGRVAYLLDELPNDCPITADLLTKLAVEAGFCTTATLHGVIYVHLDARYATATVTAQHHASVHDWGAPVFCITVPTGIFCVRHNGVTSFTGNSRYGQKGTIGAVFEPPDMPFNPKTGITPDIIINPHSIPSRMTLGHIIEKVMGKLAALSGKQADGTPFAMSEDFQHTDDHDAIIRQLGERLEQYGYDGSGEETLVDGRTGVYMKCKVFMGPMSYEKLKHMVEDKYHARPRGPKQMQTQQPVEGRHKEGGQRFGEMERDCLVAHGATALLQDRLLYSSDKSNVPVCTKCGSPAQPPKYSGKQLFAATVHADRSFCHHCLSHDTVATVQIPYAYKLSVQELQGLQLYSGFKFDSDDAAAHPEMLGDVAGPAGGAPL